jgi:ADP-ribose pyrophosphatase YjhB (NUDIX family)
MSDNEKDRYFVAVKLLLKKDGQLLIMKDTFGDWDLPGGRLKENELATPLHDVLRRKIREELGEEVEVELAENPVVFFRHERIEGLSGEKVRIFALGYEGQWQKGEIKMSWIHNEMKWVDPASFRPEEYFTGGWLKGMQEYLARPDKK